METIKHNGREYRFEIERDDYMGPPWEEHDGHGTVSEWTTRAKLPGELVLIEDRRGARRYYDFQEACKIARRDGWDAKPYNTGNETKRQQAAKAARADFENLRAWCNDEWNWVGVVVYDKCPSCGEWAVLASLWGIESTAGSYLEEVARELIEENEEQEAA